MAKNEASKPEKVDIKLGKSKTSEAQPLAGISQEELDGGFAADMHTPGDMVHPRQRSRVKKPEAAAETKPAKSDTDETEQSVNAAPTGKRPEITPPQSDNQPDTGDSNEVTDEVDTDLPEYEGDFYTSKLGAEKTQSTGRRKAKTGQRQGKHSFRVLIFFVIFLITAAAGFVTLYQLEQREPGAGIIFDLLE